jgi:hypothetical protein
MGVSLRYPQDSNNPQPGEKWHTLQCARMARATSRSTGYRSKKSIDERWADRQAALTAEFPNEANGAEASLKLSADAQRDSKVSDGSPSG